jgi:hypothetical protein
MFNQFDDVLGVPKTDYMTGSKQDLAHAVESIAQTARGEVASVEVTAVRQGPDRLMAHVVVQNKAGHRFPSGVGFRRAFLELSVVEKAADASGSAELSLNRVLQGSVDNVFIS